MIDYAKSNDSILWIHPLQNEHQQSVNNSWACILDNLGGHRLHIVRNEVLAPYIGTSGTETLPAQSRK
jgi:hypothetical protein